MLNGLFAKSNRGTVRKPAAFAILPVDPHRIFTSELPLLQDRQPLSEHRVRVGVHLRVCPAIRASSVEA